MKTHTKYFIAAAICLLLAIVSKAQPPNHIVDTTKMIKIIPPPDSVAIVAMRDFNTFFQWLQDNVSKAQYDKLTPDQVLSNFLQWAIVENDKRKKKK